VGWQMLQISCKYGVVMTTHDEVVTIAKKAQAEACIKYMAKWMSTAPAWCSDIPLNSEGGFDVNYSK
jgi:DNA polymerase I-like protein with 3'-5' exonuclease and polymerase domains